MIAEKAVTADKTKMLSFRLLVDQRESRIRRAPHPLAFCLRYSAYIASARFASKTDFCSFATLMASRNEDSISVSSAPIAVAWEAVILSLCHWPYFFVSAVS